MLIRYLLASFLRFLTGRERYFPDIEWSSESVTHNVFRAFEYVFGRSYGKNGVGDTVRAEMSAQAWLDEEGETHVVYACHSVESVFALTEQYIREYLATWKFAPFKIYIPILQTPQGIPVFSSPYLFAIAFDAVSLAQVANPASSLSWAFTVTGSNPIVCIDFLTNGGTVSSVTYNSIALTSIVSNFNSGDGTMYMYGKTGPATGSHTAAINLGSSQIIVGYSVSYTGVNQTGVPTNTNTGTTVGGTSISASVSVGVATSWLIGWVNPNVSPASAGTNTTIRSSPANGRAVLDSNATQTVGSHSLGITWSGGATGGIIVAEMLAVASGPANLKSLDANLKANIKSFCGNVIANIKSIDGNS